MQTAYILRIGPVSGSKANQQFLYVPVYGGVQPGQLVYARDDEKGLGAIAANLPGVHLICHPDLREAALARGLPIKVPEPNLLELWADMALSLAGEDEAKFVASEPPVRRRYFLRGLGAVCRSMAWDLMHFDRKISVELEGHSGGRPASLVLELRVDSERNVLALDAANAKKSKQQVEDKGKVEPIEGCGLVIIGLTDTPSYIIEPLLQAYGLPLRPLFLYPDAFRDTACATLWYPLLSATFFAAAAIPPGNDEGGVDFRVEDIHLSARASILGQADMSK